ncbi:hypothetical protein [Streptomyces sp. NPDC058701]|uniref:hypothetical protein n=1 Tax=Streptomyces sp. NPDC058701 TaxID=3346608 RepID=UPI00365F7D9B
MEQANGGTEPAPAEEPPGAQEGPSASRGSFIALTAERVELLVAAVADGANRP